MDKHKITKFIAIGVGVVLSILILVLGLRLVLTRASDKAPRDVAVSDITQNSSKITWATGEAAQSVVVYGTTTTALNFNAPETQPGITHAVDLTLLSSSTTYYFQISIGGKSYDNGGVPWTFTTKGTVVPTAAPNPTTAAAAKPTPIQTLRLPDSASDSSCTEVDCAKIKAKLGQGCSTQDYFKCIRKLTPTATASATP